MLAGNVLVLEFSGLARSLVEQVLHATAHVGLCRGPAHLWLRLQGLVHLAQERLGIRAHLAQNRQGHAFVLGQQRPQHMLRRDLLMRVLLGRRMRRRECFLSLDSKLVEPHG